MKDRISEASVLVVAPHPDDESLGCGGTIRLLTKAKTPVDVVFVTRGELGNETGTAAPLSDREQLSQIRTKEAIAACETLGVRRVRFLNGRDTVVSEQPDLVFRFCEILEEEAYGRIFCPWPGDNHTDHRATHQWLQTARNRLKNNSDLWLYEVWTPLHPNFYVPIELTIDSKVAAIEKHRSQLEVLDYKTAFLGLAAYRGLSCSGSKYAEAFQIQPGSPRTEL